MWNDPLAQYAAAQRAAARSTGTVRLHAYYLARLARHVTDPWAVTRDDLETFLGREDWAPETRKSARAAQSIDTALCECVPCAPCREA